MNSTQERNLEILKFINSTSTTLILFDKSWDLLMPVVERVRKTIGKDQESIAEDLMVSLFNNKIQETFMIVSDYAYEYNLQFS